MLKEKIEQIINQILKKRYEELEDWLDKKLYEAELDLGYEALSDFAKENGITEFEAWKLLNEDETEEWSELKNENKNEQ
ncbi:MAG: hypothetical protein KatS3mg096_798 [Candidatus Parcubacteria bacterium]|nr:MAG: hypothetical protein KatS3mg096_798 [Candidatus Parcubacteria bacterium]